MNSMTRDQRHKGMVRLDPGIVRTVHVVVGGGGKVMTGMVIGVVGLVIGGSVTATGRVVVVEVGTVGRVEKGESAIRPGDEMSFGGGMRLGLGAGKSMIGWPRSAADV